MKKITIGTNKEMMEEDFMKTNILNKLKAIAEIHEAQFKTDGMIFKLLITELSTTELDKIIKKEDLGVLKDCTQQFRRDLYHAKSTVYPVTIRKIKDSLKYNPDFSATDISKRLQVPIITVVKADIDLGLSISTDAQKTEVTNKILLYSLITRLQDSIYQMDDRNIKAVANKFKIAEKHLEEIEKYYGLGIKL
ncbi:hypothetical protein IGI37_000271 [Enterococcus sp. AZ194]|uniref:hypothetical protein n=1 Tax=Enterococcus sp. AZ194 TaxID=2774629 RepID=UPI003F243E78